MRSRDHKIGQPRQITFGQFHEPIAFFCQQVLAERGAQHRQPRFNRRQPIRRLPHQQRARPHEHLPVKRQHPQLFRRKLQIALRLPQGFNPLKQGGIIRHLG